MKQARGWYSRGYLPHFDSPEAIQHIVFRTADSLPDRLSSRSGDDPRRRSWNVEDVLDQGHGAQALADPASAQFVQDAVLHFDGERYRVLAWCVMPNHVHVLIEQSEGYSLPDVVRSWKTFTAARINAFRGEGGAFWARDYFDRFMRNETQFARAVAYIEANPVKAGLCERPEAWRFSSASHRCG